MSQQNMKIYSQVSTTPQEAKKAISAGRLKGFTDINPMWRIKRLTELFGPCGVGWRFEVTSQRLEAGNGAEVAAFVDILLYYKLDGEWSCGIPGAGGAKFTTQESKGIYTSDECFKMATTDAIGSACKMLGMSADIYFEKDRTKYFAPEDGALVTQNKTTETDRTHANTSIRDQYEKTMAFAAAVLASVTDAESANEASKAIKSIVHVATSEYDVRVLWNRKMKELGLAYDRVLKAYTQVT